LACLTLVGTMVGFGAAPPAFAAGTGVTITPATTTTASNVAVTYTVTVSCSNSGGCANAKVTFPTTGVTGNGARTDFGSWLQRASCPALSASGGTATLTLGTLPTGSQSCTFTATPPEYLTLNNAQATITPTLSGSNFTAVTGTASTLTVTAGHHAALGKSAPSGVAAGGTLAYSLIFACGAASYQGDVGLSAITVTDTLPANFTYTSYTTPSGLPGTVTYDTATRVFTYSDPTGAMCQTTQWDNGPNGANQVIITVKGTAAADGVPDATGSTICNTASSSFTYLDGTTATSTSPQACATVTNLVPNPFLIKQSGATTFPSIGQHPFTSGPTTTNYPYTFPGDWDTSGNSISYTVYLSANSASAGANFAVQDPLPCLDNYTNRVYSSPAPGGPYCANPAVIPTLITTAGFPVSGADSITLIDTAGTAHTVPYTSGTGWVVPAGITVAEIDVPRFDEEGANTSGPGAAAVFTIQGYAAGAAQVNSLLTNTATATAYAVGASTPLLPAETASASVLVADPADPNGTVLRPAISAGYNGVGTCRESVGWALYGGTANSVEITAVPSRAIYIDYLAPAGGSVTSSTSLPFTLRQVHAGGFYGLQQALVAGGASYVTAPLAATVTPDYQSTGRTRYEWVIPAGTIAVPGDYQVTSGGLTVALPPGCAGTYQNDLTVGYAAPVRGCFYGGIANPASESTAPTNPTADGDLNGNGVGTTNYCGFSSPITVTPVNPGYSVDKTVQGNLDPAPVASGGTGTVSPAGGIATYRVTFTNTGQSNLTNPVMYDLLPRVGDTLATSTTPRNSDYAVTLTALGTVPAGVAVSYSQAVNPCRPEVLATNPGCTDDWSTTPPASLGTVTALRFAYAGTIDVTGAGTSSFSVPFTVATPTIAAGKTAWNSVGTGVFAGDTAMPAAESSPTGLQAATGAPTITKTASRSTYAAVGDTVTYTFAVTNTTAVPLSGVGVTDTLTDAAAGDTAPAVTCQALTGPAASCSGATTTLQPGQSATFTASYAVNQADLDHGKITDTGTVTGTPPTGGSLTNTSAPVTVTATQQRALTLQKSASPGTVSAVGDQVSYSFLVTNTGNVTMDGIAIKETRFSGTGLLSAISCPPSSLAPGASETCAATYSVTQADLDAGSITNTAAATGTAPGGQAVTSAPTSATVTVTQQPALTLVKSADPSGGAAYQAGQQLTYHYLVTASGNTAVSGIGVHEDTFTGTGTLSAVSCPTTSLAAGAQMDCTATYTLTQQDIDSGSLANTATVSGRGPGGQPVSAQATVTTPQTPDPVLTLTKSATPGTVSRAGDRITYSFQVANTGNVTVGTVGIRETAFSGTGSLSAISCPSAALLPGQHETCTATYTVTQADVDSGSLTNTATATGTAPGGAAVTSDPSTAPVTVTQHGGLSLVKSADPSGGAAYQADQPLTYHYLVGNTGNLTVSQVSIAEDVFTGTGTLSAVSCPATTLAPGDQMDCTATYTLTQPDIDSGALTNTATVTGTLPSDETVSAQSTVATPQVPAPSLGLVQSTDRPTVSAAGDQVTYLFTVTNTGNVSVGGIAIDETSFSGTGSLSAITCPDASLLPGQHETCTVTYTATQPDLDAGLITSRARATGVAPDESAVASVVSTATVTAAQTRALALVVSAGPTAVSAVGQKVTYTFTVTNDGNVTMSDIGIGVGAFTGSGAPSDVSCPPGALAPGDRVSCTATYSVTQRDLDAGTISITATATGTDPSAVSQTSPASTATVAASTTPALSLVLSAGPGTITAPGQRIAYRFAITNTGTVTLTGVTVRPAAFSGRGTLSAIACPASTLAPQATETCTATYQATAEDLTATTITETAVAVGIAGDRLTVTSDRSTATVAVKIAAASTTVPPPSSASSTSPASAPPSTPAPSSSDPSGATTPGGAAGGLAHTGADVVGLVGAALVLLLAGALALVAGRRRRRA
jgi:uncharacterized repeat protein (TIGR01451 family)